MTFLGVAVSDTVGDLLGLMATHRRRHVLVEVAVTVTFGRGAKRSASSY